MLDPQRADSYISGMLEPTSWVSDTPRIIANLFRTAFPEATYIGFGAQSISAWSTHCCVQVASSKFTGTVEVCDVTRSIPGAQDGSGKSAFAVSLTWVLAEGDALETRGHSANKPFYTADFDDYAPLWFSLAVRKLKDIHDART